MSNEEAALVERAQQGDPAAFSEIYDRHQPAIYRYISFRVGGTAAAEDLTSEVFVRVVGRIDRFKYRGRPLLAWLYTIARNLVTDHHRRVGRHTVTPLDEARPAPGEGPEARAERHLAELGVVRALGALTEEQRQVILLKFVEGMDSAEMAGLLGKTVGSVKALQHRALAALRRAMDAEEEGSRR
jgi:RNA polymerase sigma-70 factor (ECF subfamily)